MTRRLRVSHILIQPVLIWDDGDEMEPGPEVNAVSTPLSRGADVIASISGQVAALQQRIESGDTAGADEAE